jgi:hypothetical protein
LPGSLRDAAESQNLGHHQKHHEPAKRVDRGKPLPRTVTRHFAEFKDATGCRYQLLVSHELIPAILVRHAFCGRAFARHAEIRQQCEFLVRRAVCAHAAKR